MSRDWTQKELQNASKAMKEAGHLSYARRQARIRAVTGSYQQAGRYYPKAL